MPLNYPETLMPNSLYGLLKHLARLFEAFVRLLFALLAISPLRSYEGRSIIFSLYKASTFVFSKFSSKTSERLRNFGNITAKGSWTAEKGGRAE